jgi:hypothetical protein
MLEEEEEEEKCFDNHVRTYENKMESPTTCQGVIKTT